MPLAKWFFTFYFFPLNEYNFIMQLEFALKNNLRIYRFLEAICWSCWNIISISFLQCLKLPQRNHKPPDAFRTAFWCEVVSRQSTPMQRNLNAHPLHFSFRTGLSELNVQHKGASQNPPQPSDGFQRSLSSIFPIYIIEFAWSELKLGWTQFWHYGI